MNRNEFLNGLREALENDLSGQAVQENVAYYKRYIEEEVKKGRREEEVLEELGDPWLIAKTISGSPNAEQGYQTVNESYVNEERQSREQSPRVHVLGLDTWWKKLLAIVAVVAVIAGIISIVTGIIALVMPVVVPVLCVILVIKFFTNKK